MLQKIKPVYVSVLCCFRFFHTQMQGFIQDLISGGCKQAPEGVTHGYTHDLLTYLLTYLNAAVYI